MSKLDVRPRFIDADAAFRAIVEAHRGLPANESAQLNAKLVLLLANHIGDLEVLQDALIRATRAAESNPKKND